MKKTLLAVLVGTALGFAASAATSVSAAKAGSTCGPNGLVCSGGQECCVSPGPVTYRCVPKNHCRFN